MIKETVLQRISTFLATAILAIFGFSGFAAADALGGSIIKTGPDSVNTITTTIDTNCTVTNNNDVSVTSTNDQTATSGDATVSDNTTGGSAETGNATNNNEVNFLLSISNGGNSSASVSSADVDVPAATVHSTPSTAVYDACGNLITPASTTCCIGGSGGGISTTGPNSVNTISHNAPSNWVRRNNTGARYASYGGQGSWSGRAAATSNTWGGGAGSGGANNAAAPSAAVAVANHAPVFCPAPAPAAHVTAAPSGGNINTTGPGSVNTINSSTSVNSTVTNNNNVSYSSTNNQTATSGDATVSGNTSAGSAGTGDASNGNGSGAAVAIVN